jgi:hypothetical protein
MITASDWREVVKNSLQGFVTLTLSPSGIVLKDCSLHAHPGGKRWISLPGRPLLDSEGRHRKDPVTGKSLWFTLVEIKGRGEQERFQTAALAAVDVLRGRP